MPNRLTHLRIEEGSLCPAGMNKEAKVVLFKMDKAVWDAAYVNSLPDSAFAAISPGGKKDAEGKTAPRALRHLPYKDASGKVDMPHLRNALARLSQTDIPSDMKAMAQRTLEAAARRMGMGKEGSMSKLEQVMGFVKGLMASEDTPEQEGVDEVADDEKDVQATEEEVAEEAAEETAEETPAEEAAAEEAPAEEAPAEGAVVDSALKADLAKQVIDLQKKVEAAEAMAKAERDLRITKEFADKAQPLAKIGDVDEVAEMLKWVFEQSPERADKLEGMLKAASARIDYNEVGRGGAETVSDAQGKLDKMAKDKAEKDNITKEKAYKLIMDTAEGKALYNEIQAEGSVN